MNNILDSEFIERWDGSGCPSDALLSAYAHEKLDDAISQEINAHLFLCKRCQTVCDKKIEREHDKVRKEQNRN
jgi:anti-sigma factor ChrR (cupin superfamily)